MLNSPFNPPSLSESYRQAIARLIAAMPFGIDTELQAKGRPPSLASSEFLTNKEQGDWAERIVFEAINNYSGEFVAVRYGRSESLAVGDAGFAEFYSTYQSELNRIGKKPDLLIFRKGDIAPGADLENAAVVGKAVAALEVRSSSFLADKYVSFIMERNRCAEENCARIKNEILQEPYKSVLQTKNPAIFTLIESANMETFRDIDFRLPSWSSTPHLQALSAKLGELKKQIKVLHRRDFLSITPKIEDIALVNRWIQNFGVPHYYLQVFFDKAYIISFREILEISADSSKEGVVFFVEQDVKNQGKTTIKINVHAGREIIGKIDMPKHKSVQKEQERGRLLFYVTFEGGHGYLDVGVFREKIIQHA